MVMRLTRRSPLYRKRVQIGIAAVAILAQYAALVALSSRAYESNYLVVTTLVGCIIATVLGVFLVHSVSRYPGVEASAYIIPCFSASYALLLLAFILGRIEYSRILLTSTFFINVILFLALYSVLGRRLLLRVGLIPEGNYDSLLGVGSVQWTLLRSPDADFDGLDAVAVDLRSDLSDAWERRLAQAALQNLPVYHSKHLMESLTGKVELEHLSENSFGTLSPLQAYMSVKQLVDWIAAVLALIILPPVLLAIAALIRLDSPGPILFRQKRVGYQGKPFQVYKFRTMSVLPADHGDDALEAAKTKSDDDRITRAGAFLRRSRLDELPQLLNVIRGEMSWIGPRPEAEVLSRWYEQQIPFYRYRHIVRPGITGWAQVNQGHVAEVTEVESKLHFDFYYIKNFSPWIDLLIVVRTIKTMLTGFGAR